MFDMFNLRACSPNELFWVSNCNIHFRCGAFVLNLICRMFNPYYLKKVA